MESDKVYSKQSTPGQPQYLLYPQYVFSQAVDSFSNASQGFLDWRVKYEFGKDYIVQTIAFESASPGLSPQNVSRAVFKGQFSYKANKISSARIDALALISDGFSKGVWGDILVFNPGKKITDPSKRVDWVRATGHNSGYTNVASYSDWPSESGMPDSGSLVPFQAFGNGQFFASGWQADPFAADLL